MSLEGVLLIDKPQGPTSFNIVNKIRKLSGTKRVGHAGTLDPDASGLLIVCLGAYTKLCGYLTASAKTYEAVVELGVQTNTDDAMGEIVAQMPINNIRIKDIEEACLNMKGTIAQVPPKYSALKIKGQRAYKMARAEQDFSLNAREVEIYSIEILTINLPSVKLRVHCSKGTYIRALARDIGDFLKVGAHAHSIRRIRSGAFDIRHALSFENINADSIAQACNTGLEALGELETFELAAHEYEHLRHGRYVKLSAPAKNSVVVAMFEHKPVAIMGNTALGLELLRVI